MTRSIAGGVGDTNDPFATIMAVFRHEWGAPEFSLSQFWRTHGTGEPASLLSALCKVDLHLRFEVGQTPAAQDYLHIFPQLVSDGDRALSLIYEEFCLLEEGHRAPSVSDFCSRYSPWRDSLASQLNYHREFSQIVGKERPKVRYPSVGERFASYELRSILGKGGAAQVYLAKDDLGGRQVVLKLTPSLGLEPSILANLEHRNIVSIFTVVESPEQGLHGICMPYKKGITLEALLDDLTRGSIPRRASSIWDRLGIEEIELDLIAQGWKDFPAHGTYAEAIAWLGLMLAGALGYLHKKGIYHRDIKPANILLTHTEGPLLFDFNLAHSPNNPEQAQDALNGGTLPYMAPEQLRAFLDPAAWERVGAPADIYALGLVLRELVSGIKPEVPARDIPLGRSIQALHDRRQDMIASIRDLQPEVPPSFDAIISKCLAFRPEDRYATAKDLGIDLRRFLERKPLLVAGNNSPAELIVNWIYCHRKSILGLALFGLPFVLLMGLLGGTKLQRPGVVGFDPQASSQFQAGVGLLDSGNLDHIREADLIFEDLGRREPATAWPIFYQALVKNRLEHTDEADHLLNKASSRPGFGDAIEYRLKVEPHSINLLLALAKIKLNEGEFARTRELIDQMLKADRRNPKALLLLGNLETRLRRYPQAVEAYTAVIGTISPIRREAKNLISIKETLTVVLIGVVNELLARKDLDAHGFSQVQSYLDQLQDQIDNIKLRLKDNLTPATAAKLTFDLQILLGDYNSGLGYLKARRQDPGRGAKEFLAAQKAYQDASRSAVGMPKANADSLQHIRDQQAELARRILASQVPISEP